jgi:type IV pilus assembly protein PilY1
MNRNLNAAVIFLCGISLRPALFAAPPPINFQDDPRLMFCRSAPPGSMKPAGAAISGDAGMAYEAAFDPANWTGSLKKRRIGFDAKGGAGLQDPEWDAADVLATIEPEVRHIYTLDAGNLTVPFDWSHLSSSQRNVLNTSPVTGKADGLGPQRLQYLRGDRSMEQGNPNGIFRRRQKLLGAIVNSTPTFAGSPSSAILEPGYQAFYERSQQRPAAVFVGANDGMLHAFDADDGRELFAYVPRTLLPMLAPLTRPDFMQRPYVDGAIAVSEARMAKEWKTLLVAAMRGGTQGVFALDVTDASRFDEGAGALWEFTDADDPHMGNVIGAPAIGRFYIGVRKGLPTYRYFAVVSAGPNHYVDDGTGRFDADGANALFLLALDKPPSEKWKAGSNYYKFVLPAGDASLANGLGEPALVKDKDGVTRHVYVGDLQGNLWRFDFTGVSPWSAAMGAGTPKPIFVASDEQGRRQPITARPAIVFAADGYLVLFGTGRLLEVRDLQDDAGTQSFYGVQDDPDRRGDTLRRSRLMKRDLRLRPDGGFEITGAALAYGAASKGWYLDFANAGERVLGAAEVSGHTAYFDTLIASLDPCRSSNGRNYRLDTLSGLPPDNVVTGFPFDPEHSYGPVTTPIQISPPDATGKRKIRNQRVRIANDDARTASEKPASGNPPIKQITTAGRLSWRELVDWDGVANTKK